MISLKGIIHEAAGKVLESLSAFLKRIVIVSGPIFEWQQQHLAANRDSPHSTPSLSLSVSILFTFNAKNVCNELLAYSFMLYAASLLTIARCFLLLVLALGAHCRKYKIWPLCLLFSPHTHTHMEKWHVASCIATIACLTSPAILN